MGMTRRKLVSYLLNISGFGAVCTVIYPITKFLVPPKVTEPKVSKVKVGPIQEFELNSSKIIKFGRTPVIIVRTTTGEFKAFSATCTHLDCIVQYKKETKQILCACHNGLYDLRGQNVSGPPPKPLEEFVVKIIDNEIIVTT